MGRRKLSHESPLLGSTFQNVYIPDQSKTAKEIIPIREKKGKTIRKSHYSYTPQP